MGLELVAIELEVGEWVGWHNQRGLGGLGLLVVVGEAHWNARVDISGGGIVLGCRVGILLHCDHLNLKFYSIHLIILILILLHVILP